MAKKKHIGLFEGIGGFSLAARWMEWETIAWCEKEPFCRQVLSYHFPNADKLGDIYDEDFKKYRGKCDILTGGFPCQPFSLAGSRAGTNDDRFLWGEMLRAIIEISPTWVVAENVRGLLSIERGTVFETVCSDLENAGYEVLTFIIPAASVNAPHKRERLWIIAHRTNSGFESVRERAEQILKDRLTTYPNSNRPGNGQNKQKQVEECQRTTDNCISCKNGITTNSEECQRDGIAFKAPEKRKESREVGICDSGKTSTNAISKRQRREGDRVGNAGFINQTSQKNDWKNFPTQSPICGGNDGISSELDGITFPKWRKESIKAFGNAVVPNIPFELFSIIELLSDGKNGNVCEARTLIDVRDSQMPGRQGEKTTCG